MVKTREFKLKIAEDLCKGCKLCIEFCPGKILDLTKDRINKKGYPFVEVVSPGNCIGCANCTAICPDCVIEIFEVKQGKQ